MVYLLNDEIDDFIPILNFDRVILLGVRHV